MILACHNLKKSFGDRIIVDTGSFHIEEREKAALVGVNGAGKSTIFKMIIGEEPSDGGEIILAKGRSIGYLAQHQNLIPNGTFTKNFDLPKQTSSKWNNSFAQSNTNYNHYPERN